jgi:hypothetical protein
MAERIRIFFVSIIVLVSSCAKESELPDESCRESILYENISFTPVTGRVLVEFKETENIEAQIRTLFATYDFLDDRHFPIGNFTKRVFFPLKSQTCDSLYESLILLNQHESVSAATPSLSPKGPEIYDPAPWTMVNGISIHPNNEEDIPEILEWASDNGLVWEASTYLTQRFAVKDVKTGFEPLETAIKAQKELNVKWADASFIVPINRWP